MTLPVQITFRNLKPAAIVDDWIRAEAEKLETFYDRIVDCRVAVEVPHRHHKKGKPLHVCIELNLPGKEIVVKREPIVKHRSRMSGNGNSAARVPGAAPYADLQLVIHDAFKAAGRRVQDFARRKRGEVKKHQIASALA